MMLQVTTSLFSKSQVAGHLRMDCLFHSHSKTVFCKNSMIINQNTGIEENRSLLSTKVLHLIALKVSIVQRNVSEDY